ncbi:MFS transporter [Amycolatopsis suaedae]|uniref:MFS transporter n=1 Tax=Amycolatopsis suaedae TaxID=2510978 RepID=A0A4Q7JBP7_9PSEU|nr:MFS transporter [Amycolatopsis suaedae]RZQ63694.1 MFS transporter [Amycolatopsis suaedae]
MSTPLRRPAFVRLWLASLFSETAEWILQVSLPLLVYRLTGSASSTALSMALGLLPVVALSPVAGVLADRLDRRRVLCWVVAAQAVAAVPLLLVRDAGQTGVVLAVVAAQAAAAAVFEPARNALVPTVAGAGNEVAANGLMSVTANLARLAGAGLGGVLLGSGGPAAVLSGYLIALAAAFGLLLGRFGTPVPGARGGSVVRDWAGGLAEIGGNARLRLVGAAVAVMSVAQGMFVVLFVLFVTGVLAGGDGEVGLLRGVQAVGGLAAGAALAAWGRRVAPAKVLGWGGVAMGVVSAVLWNSSHLTTALAVFAGLFAVAGGPAVVVGAGQLATVQAATPSELAGRVLSTVFAGGALCQVAGMQLAAVLAGPLGVVGALDVQAGLFVVAGVVVLYGGRRAEPLRDQRPARDPRRQRRDRRHDPARVAAGLAAGGR